MSSDEVSSDVVVIGGGISGLSFAYKIASLGKSVTVLEAKAQAGGCVRSEQFEDYWIELGAHTAYNSYGGFIEMIESTNKIDTLLPRERVSFNILAEGKQQSIVSRLGFIEAALSVPKALWLKRDEMSVRDYYGGILGKGNYERLMRHALAAVPSQHVDDFPANMLFKSRPRRKDIIRSYSLTGGLQSPLNEIGRLPGITVETNARVASIDHSDNRYQVRCEDGRTFESEAIGIAVPCPVATGLLGYIAPSAASALAEIESTGIDSMGVVVPAESVSFEPIAGLIAVDEPFFSVVSRDVVKDEKRRGFTFHFRPGTDEETRISSIERVLETNQFLHRASAVHTLPSPRMGHADRVAGAESALPDGCFLLGNYFEGLSMEDCVQRSFTQVDRYVRGS